MRSGPPDDVLDGSCAWWPTVTSWLGGTLLSATVPILSGHVTGKAGQDVPEQVTLSVPRYAAPGPGQNVIDWRPGQNLVHPLARYGQELQVSINVASQVTGDVWTTRVGRFLITDWADDDSGQITVAGDGLLRRSIDDALTTPLVPLAGGTLMSEARRLLPAGMGASFDAALVDRACPKSMAWSSNRRVALQEIADAWPALLRTDEWGQVLFEAPLPDVPVPVLYLTDGVRGTVIKAPRTDTRSDSFNRVVARSSAVDTADIQAIAEQTTGPMATTGPYGPVTKIFSSPLIATTSAALASAKTVLANALRPTRVLPLQLAPDPRITIDDALSATRNGETVLGYATAYDLPLTVGDGVMRVDLGISG